MAAAEKENGSKTRIANHKIVLHRKGVRVTIKAGEKFDYTADELSDIIETSPDALRKLVNEDDSAPEAKVPAAPKGSATAKAGQMAEDKLKAGSATSTSKSDEL